MVLILENLNVEAHEEFYKASICKTESNENFFKSYFNSTDDYICSLIETREFVSQGTTGLKTWPAAEFLLQTLKNEDIEAKEILELGSGIGYLSISLLKFNNISKITVSDHHESVLEALKDNFKANEISGDRYEVKSIDWENHEASGLDYGLIIGSDIVFDSRIIPGLVKTLKLYLKKESKAIIANVLRSDETKEAFENCLRENDLKCDLQISKYNNHDMLLYQITRKLT